MNYLFYIVMKCQSLNLAIVFSPRLSVYMRTSIWPNLPSPPSWAPFALFLGQLHLLYLCTLKTSSLSVISFPCRSHAFQRTQEGHGLLCIYLAVSHLSCSSFTPEDPCFPPLVIKGLPLASPTDQAYW